MPIHLTPSDVSRFWGKVNLNGPVPPHRPELGPCHVWTASVTPEGYGRFWADGETRRSSHVAWLISNGPVPIGMSVLHHCDTPSCVRRSHLWLGTALDNMRDKVSKGRGAPAKGIDNNAAILTEADVRSIRAAKASGGRTRDIGRQYGVSHSLVSLIATRKRWAHVI